MKVLALALVFMFAVATLAQGPADAPEGRHFPSGNRQCFFPAPETSPCRPRDRKHVWTYSRFTKRCREVYGCYQIRDNNVFRNRKACRKACVN